VYSRDFTVTKNTAARVSDWPFASVSWSAMGDESGSNPPSAMAPPSTSPSPGAPGVPSGRRLNLLMVEDNLADALLVREAIRVEGLPLEVFAASDGELAISFIENAEKDPNAPSPDAAVLDINLPKIDGFEVLRRIRSSERYKHLPVIVLTSSDSPTDRNESARMGNGYFRKRPDYDEFLKIGPAIRELLVQNGLL
jgi:chemotaxis family two-component system response regulator Rcp1